MPDILGYNRAAGCSGRCDVIVISQFSCTADEDTDDWTVGAGAEIL